MGRLREGKGFEKGGGSTVEKSNHEEDKVKAAKREVLEHFLGING